MKLSWTAARLFNQAIHATTLWKSMLATAILSAGLVYLIVASDVRGAVAPIEKIRNTPAAMTIVPANVETAHTAAGPSGARASLPAFSGTRFRFGFLEFEDDPDEAR
jgi:hypothetical protein